MNNRNIYNEIKVLQSKLNHNITKKGLSDSKTIELSEKIEQHINYYFKCIDKSIDYPKNNTMSILYKVAYQQLKDLTVELKRFPTVEEWNEYAKINNLLSSESIKYISKLNWKYLGVKVEREINMKIF